MRPFAMPSPAASDELLSIAAIFSNANTSSSKPGFSPTFKAHQYAIISLASDQAAQSVKEPRQDETPGVERRASRGAALGSRKPRIEIGGKVRHQATAELADKPRPRELGERALQIV